jgi:cyclophilin family peptidyl-prolyl cis-trans isomerase
VEALERITADGAETSRDTRLALLARLREVGTPRLAERLRPALRDFDPVVAESASALLSTWTGRAVPSAAAPRTLVGIPQGEIAALRGATIRLLMASGDTIDAELLTDEAPLTVARIARLARRGYYDGLTFHRVVPNFVIQGGSPGANEYAGDGPYLRDELTARSHERGTFGISTRGRDTGDAQLFVNLVDNARLDYDYTVWARVVRGMDVLDRIGEGDVIRRLEIRAR